VIERKSEREREKEKESESESGGKVEANSGRMRGKR
jgi:hypothetical protein